VLLALLGNNETPVHQAPGLRPMPSRFHITRGSIDAQPIKIDVCHGRDLTGGGTQSCGAAQFRPPKSSLSTACMGRGPSRCQSNIFKAAQ
jgi:hypothetical protein